MIKERFCASNKDSSERFKLLGSACLHKCKKLADSQLMTNATQISGSGIKFNKIEKKTRIQ